MFNFRVELIIPFYNWVNHWSWSCHHGLAGAGVGVALFLAVWFCIKPQSFRRRRLFKYAMLGFALTEAVGLLALMMAFLILFS